MSRYLILLFALFLADCYPETKNSGIVPLDVEIGEAALLALSR
jgi:hypothetical protein